MCVRVCVCDMRNDRVTFRNSTERLPASFPPLQVESYSVFQSTYRACVHVSVRMCTRAHVTHQRLYRAACTRVRITYSVRVFRVAAGNLAVSDSAFDE